MPASRTKAAMESDTAAGVTQPICRTQMDKVFLIVKPMTKIRVDEVLRGGRESVVGRVCRVVGV